jgi:N-acetylmuramoyl-L-alanine amidase
MFNSKRGEVADLLMHPAFVIFMAFSVLLYLLWFAHGIGTEQTFEKKFLATDMALTIDSLLAAKDNVILYYLPQGEDFESKFNYSFDKNQVIVFEDKNIEKNAGRYYFTSDPSITMKKTSLIFKEPFILPRFALLGNELFINDAHDPKQKLNMYLLECPSKKLGFNKVTLDPGHGYTAESRQGNTGFSSEDRKEYILTREIAGITKRLDTVDILSDLTRDGDFALSINDRKSRVKDAVISIHIGSYSTRDNFIKAYINYDSNKRDESLKLACELVNQISSNLIENNIKITGIAVIPIIPEKKQDEQWNILVEDKPAVFLELGNIKIKDNFEVKSRKAIASGIIGGIKNAHR